MLRVLSLGAGVRSSTILLMSDRGLLPRLDAAIFADTGWESPATYEWLDWLESITTIPIRRTKSNSGTAKQHLLRATETGRFASLPVYILGEDGSLGRAPRHCTREFKLGPIVAELRSMLGYGPRKWMPKEILVEQWIGISIDEAHCIKPSRDHWIKNVWPLVELIDPPMKRADCLKWFSDQGLPAPPRSACVGCPFRGDDEWLEMKDKNPEAWADAVAADEAIRNIVESSTGTRYLHKSRKPLVEAVSGSHDSMWGEECEGVCGL